MRIKENVKLREMAGLSVLFLQGEYGMDMSKIVSLNPTSVYLWEKIENREFNLDELVHLLMEEYEVDETTAHGDCQTWINQLIEANLIEA